jgi:hypothetical protein
MAIAGLRGPGDWGTDERPKDFRGTLLKRNPNGTAPILALSSRAGKRSVKDPEFIWWDEGNDITRLQVNGALSSSDTLFTVDSPDPSISSPGIVYGTATNLKEGDVLLVEPATDSATYNHELIEVTQVVSDTQFIARRGVGGTSAASISNDIFLTLIGSSYAEGTGVPRAVSRNPMKYSNYTQIFKDTYELTGTADETETRTGPAYSEDKKRKMWKHAADIEWSIMFGRKHETTGDNGKPKRYMGGLRSFIPSTNVTVFGAAVTVASYYAALEPLFQWETGAGNTRIAFAGSDAVMQLQTVFNASTNVTRDLGASMKVYGMELTEFRTPMGTLLLKIHPLLSRHGLYKKSMFILDFDAINYIYLRNRDTKARDDVQAKDEDVRRGFFMTECSLEVLYGGLTMAYLGNISAT